MSQADLNVDVNIDLTAGQVQALWLVIGSQSIAWGVVGASGGAARWVPLGSVEVPEAPARGRVALHALMQLAASLPAKPFEALSNAGAGLHVWLDDDWVSVGGIPWSDALVRNDDAKLLARAQLKAQGHEFEPSDLLRLDDMPYGQPRLAAVYPAEILSWVEERAQAWSVRLCSVRGATLAAWLASAQRAALPVLAVLRDDALILMGNPGTKGRARHIAERHVLPLAWRSGASRASGSVVAASLKDGLAACWRRQVLRSPVWSSVNAVPVVNIASEAPRVDDLPPPFVRAEGVGDAVGGGTLGMLGDVLVALSGRSQQHALDAVCDHQARNRVLVPMAVVCVLALALVTWQVGKNIRAERALSSAIAQYSSPPPLHTAAPPLTKQELQRVPAINHAIRQLNLPVHALLRSLEPPRDLMVAVLSVDSVGQSSTNGGASSVRIVAQAPHSADMTRYVAFVADRKPFTGAYLRRHEWVDGPQQKLVRFTVEATWND